MTIPQVLRNWFRYRNGKRNRLLNNPWRKLLDGLHRDTEGTSRRALPPWQLFMSLEHDQVMAEYDRRYPGCNAYTRARDMAARTKIARELFAELEETEQEEYELECMRLHDAALEEAKNECEASREEIENADVAA